MEDTAKCSLCDDDCNWKEMEARVMGGFSCSQSSILGGLDRERV